MRWKDEAYYHCCTTSLAALLTEDDMSWSVSYIGTPGAVAAALDKYATTLGEPSQSQSRAEFDAALPHLKALVLENVHIQPSVISVTASGHATLTNGVKTYGSCDVTIKPLYGVLVDA